MSSYYTKYFENDDISAIKSNVDKIISYLNNASTQSTNLISSYLNDSNWVSTSTQKVEDALEDNRNKIQELISLMDKYKTILSSANLVLDAQDKMDTMSDYDKLVSKSSEISSEIDNIISSIESL